MNKNHLKRWLSWMLCGLLLLSLQLPLTARAAEKYMDCSNAEVYLTLDETGGATVTESWNCYFGGDAISRYHRRYKNPDPDYCSMEVLSVSVDGKELVLLDAPDDNRPEGFAAVYLEDGKTNIEVYLRAQEDEHSISVTYYMKNAVILYNDVADFHWNLSSEKESFDIETLSAWIEIPHGTADHGLAYWAHGTSEDATFDAQYDEENKPYAFLLSTADIPRDKSLWVQFALPTELFPQGTRRVEEDALQRIMDQQHGVNQPGQPDLPFETEPSGDPDPGISKPVGLYGFWLRVESLKNAILSVWSVLSIVLCFGPFIILLLFGGLVSGFVQRKLMPKRLAEKRFKPFQAPDYYRTLPDQLSPAVVNRLLSVYPIKGECDTVRSKGNAFSATILDLAERGLLQARRNADNAIVYRVLPEAAGAELAPHEQVILNLFTTAGASTAEMTTEEITSYMRNNYDWCKEQYRLFKTAADEAFDATRLAVLQQHAPLPQQTMRKICIFYGVFVAIGIAHVSFLLAGLLVGAAVGLVGGKFISIIRNLFYPDYYLLTQEGENRYALWKAYVRYLNDFTTLQDRTIDDLSIWRRHLVYATALGCSENVIDSLKVSMPDCGNSFVSDDSFVSDSAYLSDYDELYASVSSINEEAGYTIYSSSDSSDSSSDWDSDNGGGDDDWGDCSSDDSGDCDSGSDGSDFD